MKNKTWCWSHSADVQANRNLYSIGLEQTKFGLYLFFSGRFSTGNEISIGAHHWKRANLQSKFKFDLIKLRKDLILSSTSHCTTQQATVTIHRSMYLTRHLWQISRWFILTSIRGTAPPSVSDSQHQFHRFERLWTINKCIYGHETV